MSEIGLAVLCFDFKFGPQILFSKNTTDEFCKSIGLKVLMSGLSVEEATISESIVQAPEAEKTLYSVLFPLYENEQKEPRPSGISLIVPPEHKHLLYSAVPQLRIEFEKIAKQLQSSYKFNQVFPKAISNMLEKFTLSENIEKISKGVSLTKSQKEKLEELYKADEGMANELKIIQLILTDQIGPMGKIIVKRISKGLQMDSQIKSEDLSKLYDAIINELRKTKTLNDNQLNELRNRFEQIINPKKIDQKSEIVKKDVLIIEKEQEKPTNKEYEVVKQILVDVVGPMGKKILSKMLKQTGYDPADNSADIAVLIQAIFEDLSKAKILSQDELSDLNRRIFKEALGYGDV